MHKRRGYWSQFRGQLAECTDRQLAEYHQCSLSAVRDARRRLGISKPNGRSWPEALAKPYLGKLPDHRIGKLVGVSKNTVCRARHRRGIPSRKSVLLAERFRTVTVAGVLRMNDVR